MKQILMVLVVLLLSVQSANAKLIKVEAESDFSTANPPETWRVIVAEDVQTKRGHYLRAGSVFEGDITDVVSPKRMKRDASFVFVPKVFYDIDGTRYDIKYQMHAQYSFMAKLNPKDVAKKGALTAGNLVIQGISPAIQVAEGIYKNKEGNRFKSGAVAAVDATPLSYYKKGDELEFKKGDIFKMNFEIDE